MDRIDLFRVFTRVVEAASFSRAAASLGMSRSSVSTAIQDLETRLGARLLARTTRSVAPTADGRAFYEQACRLVSDMEDVESLFRRDRKTVRGTLRVDVPGRIGRLIVAPALPAFLEQYPDLDIELGVTDRAVNLIEDGADCVVRVGPLQDSTLVGRKIGTLALITVASPAYCARHGTPDTPAALRDHLAVRYASPSTGRVEEWEWEEDGTIRSMPVPGRVTVNSAEALIACGLAGMGLIQIPAYDVRVYLETGQLVEVLHPYRAEPLQMTLLYPNRRHLSPRLEVFADWISALLIRETGGEISSLRS